LKASTVEVIQRTARKRPASSSIRNGATIGGTGARGCGAKAQRRGAVDGPPDEASFGLEYRFVDASGPRR